MDLKKLKLFNARNNIIKMCTDRGYEVHPSLQRLKFQEFLQINEKDIHIVSGITRTVAGRVLQVIVYFCSDSYTVSEIISDLNTSHKTFDLSDESFGETCHLFAVVDYVKLPKGIEEYDNNDFIEYHNLKVVSVNTMENIYQAEYKLLHSKDEAAKQVKMKYMTTGSSLMTICIDDPVNKYYGGHVNDIYEIYSQTPNGTRKTYRIVCMKRINIPANEK